jgi:glyoxylate reductase
MYNSPGGESVQQKRKVVLTRKYQEEAIRQLQEDYDLVIVEDSGKSLSEVLRENPDTEALISFLSDNVDRGIMDLGKNLKVIANYAVGYNNIDVACALEKGIPVTHTPDVLTGATADMAFALLLAVSRRVVEGDRVTRAGKFTGWSANFMLGKEISGLTIGIIGLGRIGLATALRAQAFGMKTAYYSRTRKKENEAKYGLTYMSFEDLLTSSDVISLHVPSTAETYHMMNRENLDMMKKDAIFINVSRGDLVEEAALADKLEQGELFGAGLDVYEFEPKVTEKLKRLDNVVLAPHLGSATYKTRMGMAQMTVDNVNRVLEGRPPQNPVKECKDLWQ